MDSTLTIFLMIPVIICILIYVLIKRNKNYKSKGIKTNWKAVIVCFIILLIFSIIRGTLRDNAIDNIKNESIDSQAQTQ